MGMWRYRRTGSLTWIRIGSAPSPDDGLKAKLRRNTLIDAAIGLAVSADAGCAASTS
jgi:hypothetical protein